MIINIIDRIGTHSGMDYYQQAFKAILESKGDVSVKILSNYSDDGSKPIFVDQYNKRLPGKVFSLIRNLRRLKKYVKSHRNEIFIINNFGEIQDLLFMTATSKGSVRICDIHEAIAQDKDDRRFFLNQFRHFYSKTGMSAIIHSKRSSTLLDNLGFENTRFFVPHFRYIFNKNYCEDKVGQDLKNSVVPSKTNILFFGNLNYNKGIDVLIKAVNMLSCAAAEKLNFIVAGKNHDDSCFIEENQRPDILHISIRHISDDELIYLFNNVQFIALPYRKTSQSGILEMSLFFKKPILATDVEYFHNFLEQYPSFGLLSNNNASSYCKLLERVANNDYVFFCSEDCKRYENKDENEKFLSELRTYLKGN